MRGKRVGQVMVEVTLAIIGIAMLVYVTGEVFTWLNRMTVERNRAYQRTRVEAAKPPGEGGVPGQSDFYERPMLSLIGPPESTGPGTPEAPGGPQPPCDAAVWYFDQAETFSRYAAMLSATSDPCPGGLIDCVGHWRAEGLRDMDELEALMRQAQQVRIQRDSICAQKVTTCNQKVTTCTQKTTACNNQDAVCAQKDSICGFSDDACDLRDQFCALVASSGEYPPLTTYSTDPANLLAQRTNLQNQLNIIKGMAAYDTCVADPDIVGCDVILAQVNQLETAIAFLGTEANDINNCNSMKTQCSNLSGECQSWTTKCNDATAQCNSLTSQCTSLTNQCNSLTTQCDSLKQQYLDLLDAIEAKKKEIAHDNCMMDYNDGKATFFRSKSEACTDLGHQACTATPGNPAGCPMSIWEAEAQWTPPACAN